MKELQRSRGEDGDEGDPLDALEFAIEAAKLTPRKQTILGKISAWRGGKLGTFDLVEQIETIYDELEVDPMLWDEWDD